MTLIFLIIAGLLAVPVTGQGRLNMPQYLQDPNTDDESGLTEMNGGPSGGIVPFQMNSGMRGRFSGQGPSPFPRQNMGMNSMFNGRPQTTMRNDDDGLFLPGDPLQGGQNAFPPFGRNQNPFPMRERQQGGMNSFPSMPAGTSRIVTFPQMNPQGDSNFGQRGPPLGQNGSPFGQNGSPFGQNGSPFGQNGSPFEQNGSPFLQNGIPFSQNGQNFGPGGPNFGQSGPNFGQGGSNFGQGGSPFGQNGFQNGFQGSPFGQGGSSNAFPDSPFDQQSGFQGSPSGQNGFPGSSFGQPGLQGSPFSQLGGFNSRGPQGLSFSRGRPNMNEDDFSNGLSGDQRSLGGMRQFSLGQPDNEGNTNPYIPGFGFVRGNNGMGQGGPSPNRAGSINPQGGQMPDYDADQNGISDRQSVIGGPLCPNQVGMYGDPQSGCSMYYMCQSDKDGSRRDTFSCPTTTKFNNKIGVCDYAINVDDNCNPLSDSSQQSSKRRYISPSAGVKSKENKTKNISKKLDSNAKQNDQ